jgi:hypothetical protein
MRLLLAFYLALISQTVFGIVIEPDDYAAGTDLSQISPYVSLWSTFGDPVIASEIPAYAAEGYDTKGLGDHIFGLHDRKTWWYPGEGYPALTVTFEVPVVSFSLLIAELYYDSEPGDDLVVINIFDPQGNTLEDEYEFIDWPRYERVDLGRYLEPLDGYPYYWNYIRYTYSAESIGGFIIGGAGEGTHLDRLEFTIPEPSSALLLLTGLLITGLSLPKKPLTLSK